MSHTPGPWEFGSDNGFWIENTCIQAETEVGSVVICDFVHTSAVEEKSNKLLIKAAPDLLEACEAAIRAFVLSNPRSQKEASTQSAALDMLRKAVAKAKGETP